MNILHYSQSLLHNAEKRNNKTTRYKGGFDDFLVSRDGERLFLAVPRDCLQFVIVVFPDHTHLLFYIYNCIFLSYY